MPFPPPVSAVYTAAAESMHNQGKVGLVLIDDGRLLQISAKDIAALLSTDLWQAIKAQAPLKVSAWVTGACVGVWVWV